ncbi:MAG: NAD(P)-dependent oxidoreductase [Actinomycetia bacterium]|nr:NAD(P)-dependent oxidoreductase [Actinomycetes bacterium]
MRIGFVGLGAMGLPMALNLVKAGHEVVAYNRSGDRTGRAAAGGIRLVGSPAEAARGRDVVITMVADDAAVRSVMFGPEGVRAGAGRDTVVVDSSTVSPALSRELHATFAGDGVAFLDAPVTGSTPQAEAGALVFMVGGAREVFDRLATPVFRAMGQACYYMGGPGAGAWTKLANNLMVAVNAAATAEGLALAERGGIDPATFLDVVMGGGATNGIAVNRREKFLRRDFAPNFRARLMLKDLNLAQGLSADEQLVLPVLGLVHNLFRALVNSGRGDQDISAVYELYRLLQGEANQEVGARQR